MSSQEKDEEFEKAEREFRILEKALKLFLKNLAIFCDQAKVGSMYAPSWYDVVALSYVILSKAHFFYIGQIHYSLKWEKLKKLPDVYLVNGGSSIKWHNL